jgi:hypothetical protein
MQFDKLSPNVSKQAKVQIFRHFDSSDINSYRRKTTDMSYIPTRLSVCMANLIGEKIQFMNTDTRAQ